MSQGMRVERVRPYWVVPNGKILPRLCVGHICGELSGCDIVWVWLCWSPGRRTLRWFGI